MSLPPSTVGYTLSFAPLPSDHPLTNDMRPLTIWNHDYLLKNYLALCGEPIPGTDHALLKSRVHMFRARMFELDPLLSRTMKEGRRSDEIERELASILYKRKLLLCMTFPILELPSEILTAIFRIVVWSSPGADQANVHRLHLTWVCRRFRAVALADQTLWNSIWFRDSFPWRRSLAFIERAGTSPIDLRINEKERKPNDKDKALSAITVPQIDLILDAILPKISQIRILVVLLDRLDTAERFITRFSTAGNPELLERYEVHRSGLPYLWPHEQATGAGGRVPLSTFPTPKLRWLSLNGIPLDWQKLSPVNLRTIDLRRMSVQACPTSERWTQMLQAAPSLYKLALDAAGPQWSPKRFPRLPRVELPNLRDVLIGDISCLFSIYVLGHMKAPRVMNLSLMHLSGQDYTMLIETLTGLFPELRLLSMWTVDLPATENHLRKVVRWLESMPRLKMIKIAEMKRFVLDAFSEEPSKFWSRDQKEIYAQRWKETFGDVEMKTPVLLPELEYLFAQAQHEDDISALVAARSRIGKPFKKVFMPDISIPNLDEEERQRISAHSEFAIVSHQSIAPEEELIHEEIVSTAEQPPSIFRRMGTGKRQ